MSATVQNIKGIIYIVTVYDTDGLLRRIAKFETMDTAVDMARRWVGWSGLVRTV